MAEKNISEKNLQWLAGQLCAGCGAAASTDGLGYCDACNAYYAAETPEARAAASAKINEIVAAQEAAEQAQQAAKKQK